MAKFEQASEEQINETLAFLKQKIYGSEGQSVADATQTFSQNNDFEENDEFVEDETTGENDVREFFVNVTKGGKFENIRHVKSFGISEDENDEDEITENLTTEIIETISDDKSKQKLYRMKINDEIMNSANVEEEEYLFLDKFIDNIRDDNKTMVIYIDLVDVLEEHESSVLDLQMFDTDEINEIGKEDVNNLIEHFNSNE